jgi:hypothetical protein
MSPSMAGLMPGSADTLVVLLADDPHMPLMPVAASRMTVRTGK